MCQPCFDTLIQVVQKDVSPAKHVSVITYVREISNHGNGGWGSGEVDNVRLVLWGQKLHSLLSLQVRQLLLDATLLEADEVVQPCGRSNLGELCMKNDRRRRRRRGTTTTTKTTSTTKWFNQVVDPTWVTSAWNKRRKKDPLLVGSRKGDCALRWNRN